MVPIKANNKIKIFIIIPSAIITLLIIGGIVFMFGTSYVSIKGQKLNVYEFHSGGGMTGGYYSENVKKYDDTHALISIEKAEWHNQDPEISEYLVDMEILDELESVIRKNRMNFWNNKKFTNMFVADGESEGYYFSFDENSINFSSQIYPPKYNKKLKQLDEILDKYLKDAQKLPALVNDRISDEENYDLPEEKIELYAYSYSRRDDSLYVRVLNGTNDDVEIPKSFKLINTDSDTIIDENNEDYTSTFYPKSSDGMSFSLKERLDAGNYKIILGDIEIPFEIR